MPNDETRATLTELFAGRYTVEEKLDWGGLALFYEAMALDGAKLALAVLPLDCESNPVNGAIFEELMEAFKTLDAPGMVPLLEVGVQLGVPFIAYDFSKGRPLAFWLDKGAMEPEEALKLTRSLLAQVEVIHTAGLFHGDLTPFNVLVSGDEARILGTGIAQVLRRVRPTDVTGPTGRGSGKGAVRYLAPEVVGGGVGDPSADIFSLGALLHHMITGEPPGRGSADSEVYDAVPGLRDVIERAMSHNPADRWPSGAAMREALDLEVLEEARLSHPPAEVSPLWQMANRSTASAPPPPMPARRRRMWPWVAAVLILGGAGMAAYLLRPSEGGSETRRADAETEVQRGGSETETEPEVEAETGTEPTAESGEIGNDEPELEAEAVETETEISPATDLPHSTLGLVGPLASGPLPDRLRIALMRIDEGHRFEEEDFNDLYGYCRMNRDDIRGHLVLARAFMSRDWYTAALERYEHALKLEAGATEDPQVLEDLLEIVAYGDDMVWTVWPNIRRFYGREAIDDVERAIENTPRWTEQRPLESLKRRLERLE